MDPRNEPDDLFALPSCRCRVGAVTRTNHAMCMTTALNERKSNAIVAAVGSISAVLGVMTVSALGLGALLAASGLAFTTVKVIGSIYLIWLGIKTFGNNAEAIDFKRAATETRRRLCPHYVRGLLVGSSNPKAILFFSAFFPQFLNPVEPFAAQFSILAITFIACEFGAGNVRLGRFRDRTHPAVQMAQALD
jgi:threonine/homoserine/homoserine lactone efflux protein